MADGAASNRAIAYVRVSTTRQAEVGNSIASQSARIRKYAKDRGLKLMSRDIIIDDGVSGGVPFEQRSGGRLVMKRVESGEFGHLISLKLDRMSRDQIDAVQTIDLLDEEGISVHFVDWFGSSLDTRSPMGRFMLQLVAALAEMERGLISERTRDGMEYLRQNMMRFTHSIYGWNVRKDGSLVPNWMEQDAIDYMVWQMKGNDMSATSVARSMNKKGHTGKLGGKWNSSSVLRTVRNGYHTERPCFGYPKGWGSKPWHRGGTRRKNGQRDERIDKPPPVEAWGKDDL